MALHKDPVEEPFCSPTDAPVATERYRRQTAPHGNANRRQREGKTTSRENGMGRARHLLPLCFDPKKPADATTFFANRHEPNRRPYAHNRKPRMERTLQPRTGSSLRTEHGPIDPVFGANPSSEGTDQFCRLPYIDAIDERLYTLETCRWWCVRTGSIYNFTQQFNHKGMPVV